LPGTGREIGIDEAFVDLHFIAKDVSHALELAHELSELL
jgi:hypothetical protein